MTALPPIGIQLYSLREALADDFAGVIHQLADAGYVGVEPYNGMPVSAQEAARLFQQHNLQVSSAHLGMPLGDDQQKYLETAAAYGIEYFLIPSCDHDFFASVDGIKGFVDQLHQAQEVVQKHGMVLGYHNHDFEFQRIDGRYGYDIFLENLNPDITLQIDTYWVQVGGADPADYVKRLDGRAPLLHIKDGPGVRGEPMLALGEGVIDVPAIVQAGVGSTEWLIVELDACATDMMTAVAKSCRYLIDQGLGRGRDS